MESLTKPKSGSRRKVHKDQSAPAKAATIGDNNPPLDQEGFLVWLGKFKQEDALFALARKRRDKVRKLAKNAGVELQIMDRIIKEEEQDPDIILRWMKTYRMYSEWAMSPIGQQLSLFDIPNSSLLSHEERLKKAQRAGYALGLTGKDPDKDAYPPDHEFHQIHMEGWHNGQRILLERIKPIDDAIDSEAKPEPEKKGEDEAAELEEA